MYGIQVKFLYLRPVVFPERVDTEKGSLPHVSFGFLVVILFLFLFFLICFSFPSALLSHEVIFTTSHSKLYYGILKHFEFFFCSVKHFLECSLLYTGNRSDFGKKNIHPNKA